MLLWFSDNLIGSSCFKHLRRQTLAVKCEIMLFTFFSRSKNSHNLCLISLLNCYKLGQVCLQSVFLVHGNTNGYHLWYKGTYRTVVSNSHLMANNNQFGIAGMAGEQFTHLPKPSGWHTHKSHILKVPAKSWLLSLNSFCIQFSGKYLWNLFFSLKCLQVFIEFKFYNPMFTCSVD